MLKEIVAPAGAVIEIRDMLVGDATLSVLELWGAEFQVLYVCGDGSMLAHSYNCIH